MRELKFRSAHYSNKTDEFVRFSYWGKIDHKGNYSDDCFTSPSSSNDSYRKVEEQYVGKIGANECEVWENDVVKATLNHHGKPSAISFNAYIKYNIYVGTWQICYKNINNEFITDNIGFSYFLEVIGNIHQNPELL